MQSERFPRPLIRKLESTELPLQALYAIRQLREYVDNLEATCILKARELGVSPADVAEALGVTRQAVYYKLRALDRRQAAGETIVIPELETPRPEP